MFKKIIFPIDLQDIAHIEPQLREVENLVRHTGAELKLVSVLPGYSTPLVASYFPEGFLAKAKASAEKTLADFISQQVDSSLQTSFEVREGRAHTEIRDAAEEWGADLIAIPSHVQSGIDVLLGSVAQRVAERASCSVLILRAAKTA